MAANGTTIVRDGSVVASLRLRKPSRSAGTRVATLVSYSRLPQSFGGGGFSFARVSWHAVVPDLSTRLRLRKTLARPTPDEPSSAQEPTSYGRILSRPRS